MYVISDSELSTGQFFVTDPPRQVPDRSYPTRRPIDRDPIRIDAVEFDYTHLYKESHRVSKSVPVTALKIVILGFHESTCIIIIKHPGYTMFNLIRPTCQFACLGLCSTRPAGQPDWQTTLEWIFSKTVSMTLGLQWLEKELVNF